MHYLAHRAMLKQAYYLLNLIVFIMLLLPALAIDINIWWLDNLLNLQLQLTALALLLILINLIYIKQLRTLFALLYSIVIAINLTPLYIRASLPVANIYPIFTVAQLNVSYDNPNLQQLLPILGDPYFDLLVLQEVSDKEHQNIKQLALHYPYSFGLDALEATPSGLALFSRSPITEKWIHELGYKSGQLLEAVIQVPGSNAPLQIYALHPSSPRNKALWQQRNQTLNTVATKVANSAFINKMVIGDFNSSPWSRAFQQLQENSQLKSSATGFGYIASWSYSDKPLLSLLSSAYIDHALVSHSLYVLNKYSQRIQGSDHQLVITELSFAQ